MAAIGEPRGPEEPKYLLWTGPGSGGLGNTILSFLTAFYDAMRSGRRIARVSVPEVGKFFAMHGLLTVDHHFRLSSATSSF